MYFIILPEGEKSFQVPAIETSLQETHLVLSFQVLAVLLNLMNIKGRIFVGQTTIFQDL